MSHPKTCSSSKLEEVEQRAFFSLLFFEPQPFRCLDLRDCDLTRCLSLWLKPPQAAVNPFLARFTVLLSVKFFGPLRIKTWTGVLTQRPVRVWSFVSRKRRLGFLLPPLLKHAQIAEISGSEFLQIRLELFSAGLRFERGRSFELRRRSQVCERWRRPGGGSNEERFIRVRQLFFIGTGAEHSSHRRDAYFTFQICSHLPTLWLCSPCKKSRINYICDFFKNTILTLNFKK